MKITMKVMGCNLACPYCHFQFTPLNSCLIKEPIIELFNFIRVASRQGITHIHWTGGEPTCYPGLNDAVSYAKEFGIYQSLSTNGTKEIQEYKKLQQSGISRINVSLDTLNDKLYEKLTGSTELSRVIDNIRLFKSIFFEPTKINTVVTRENLSEVSKIYKDFASPEIVPRFLELIPHPEIEYTTREVVPLSSIMALFPEATKHHANMGTWATNPTAQYYHLAEGVFGIVPRNKGVEILEMKYTPSNGAFAIQKILDVIKEQPEHKRLSHS